MVSLVKYDDESGSDKGANESYFVEDSESEVYVPSSDPESPCLSECDSVSGADPPYSL